VLQALEQSLEIGVRELGDGTPGIEGCRKAALALVDVAHTRHQLLVEQCFPQSLGPSGHVKSGHPSCRPETWSEKVRPEARELGVGLKLALSAQHEACPAELRRYGARRRQDDPGATTAAISVNARLVDPPRSVHTQVAVKDQPELEVEQQVLAPGLRGQQPIAAQPTEPGRLESKRTPGIRDGDVQDALAADRGIQTSGGAVDSVAFGHVAYSRARWEAILTLAWPA
jgi:hypothetical protein